MEFKKRDLIVAGVVLAVPLLVMSVRILHPSKGQAPQSNDVSQTKTSPNESAVASKSGAPSAATPSSKKDGATKVSASKGREQKQESANAVVKDVPADRKSTESTASAPGFFSRMLGGLGLGGAAKTATTANQASQGAVPGLSGQSGANAPSGPGAVGQAHELAKTEPTQKPEPTDGCFTETFHHKKLAGHSSEESCSQHRNLIRLKYEHVSQVCIRVNRTPVAFQAVKGKRNEFIIGAVAGPRAEITARYCFGKTQCDEDCSVPKDDFMGSIGGETVDGGKQVAQWDSADAADKDGDVTAHLDSDMKKELDRLDEKPTDELFADWIPGTEAPACGTKHAMN